MFVVVVSANFPVVDLLLQYGTDITARTADQKMTGGLYFMHSVYKYIYIYSFTHIVLLVGFDTIKPTNAVKK